MVMSITVGVSPLLGWAKDKLGLLLKVIKRSDDARGFQALPRR
jgi:hypothetical protein